MTTCKACDAGNDWLTFNWKAAIDGETKDLAAMAKALQYICEAKTGELYACTICKGQWFLTDGNMYPISPEKITIFTDWCRKNRCPTAEQHNLLASVVGTNFRNGKDICIPVKVTHEDGTVHEQAIVVVTKNPPTGIVDRQNELLGSEKMQFEPTRYALPLSVRRASANAKDFGGGHIRLALHQVRVRFIILMDTQICSSTMA